MIRRVALLVVAAAMLAAAASGAAAQAPLEVKITLPPGGARATQGPLVALNHLFNDRRSRDFLESGFVTRLDVTVELWQSRTGFDQLLEHASWVRFVKFDPVRKNFAVGRAVRPDSIVNEGQYQSLDAARAAMSVPQRAPIVAPAATTSLYYRVIVTVESLNSDDLAEVQRWLRGDVQPTIRGKQGPVSFISRTVGWIASRLFGGDTKQAEASSEIFSTT